MSETLGKLKIFLGYAAGVGKTYTMLQTAQQMQANGVDVVVGYVEPHQRPETQAQTLGLEQIPPLVINYKGLHVLEFDVDAALVRHPEVILVDELAHSNAPSAIHAKRYQDIETLLNHGIDVFTTVNIQHVESLNDLVAAISKIEVNERIPDRIIELADSIELIDIDPVELMDRLRRGKIYKTDQANRALENFFTIDKLTALREVALRRTADHVTQARTQNYAYYRDGNIAIAEHILVCLSAAPSNAKVIRNAARMADAFHAKLTAIYVLGDDTQQEISVALLKNMRLAEDLGAVVTPLYGDEVPLQIAEYAKTSYVTKIVLGRSSQSHGFLGLRRTLIDRILEYAPDIDVYVIPDRDAYHAKQKVRRHHLKERFTFKDGFLIVGMLMVATLIGFAFESLGFNEANIIAVYILGVMGVAILTTNRMGSILASLISVVIFNLLFTDPKYTLVARDPGYPATFLIMFILALITSNLALRLRINDRRNAQRSYRTEVLLETSLRLQKTSTREEVIDVIGKQVQHLLDSTVLIYLPIDGELIPTVYSYETPDYIHDELLTIEERAIAKWVYENNRRAGANTRTLGNAKCTYYAIRSDGKPVAVIGIQADGEWELHDKNILVLMINELGFALETIALNEERQERELAIHQEKLRSNILRSISHDLRTPLTSISGNVQNLLTTSVTSEQQVDIYQDILDDTHWLTNIVENILAMTHLEEGTQVIDEHLEVLEDLVLASVAYVQEKNPKRKLEFQGLPDVAMIRGDGKLLKQVFVNLLDNALKFSSPETSVQVEFVDEGSSINVLIKDQGWGISLLERDKIFAMFYTTSNQKGDAHRGLGLGLYLCQSIAEAHKTHLEMSENVPHGCIFAIRFKKEVLEIHG